jgi:hypothetical protein
MRDNPTLQNKKAEGKGDETKKGGITPLRETKEGLVRQ